MEVKYMKRSIQIIPENKLDEVYLESALGLRKRGDWAKAERVLLVGLGPARIYFVSSNPFYVKIKKKEER